MVSGGKLFEGSIGIIGVLGSRKDIDDTVGLGSENVGIFKWLVGDYRDMSLQVGEFENGD